MTQIFDGKAYADKKLTKFAKRIKQSNIKPTLVIILAGDNKPNLLYTKLKQTAAQKIGARVIIKKFPSSTQYTKLAHYIKESNEDSKIHGIMIQLPLPSALRDLQSPLIHQIDSSKDVDGLRSDSPFTHPTALAILETLKSTAHNLTTTICLVGATGTVGKSTIKLLKKNNFKNIIACDINTKNLKEKTLSADIIISATGTPSLIKPDMVKRGVALIDVGYPKGDIDPTTHKKASFATPVPGGIGPLTIASLLENLTLSTVQSN